ncbi:hypothetical protein TSOC_005178 [Tetrabaena socialis]|uniref:Uncharacterized protein n=1 Tax=Tetrabaena socialis TaxID=47790 RepID=A0A2J8A717_9CHLO|nr:hypothetical protein TSOC_005178 [Tetrabaena socialis]|eukprot:PNH08290.1 hypothetical protein TSOC_005178 [Tetrabaena socialis]
MATSGTEQGRGRACVRCGAGALASFWATPTNKSGYSGVTTWARCPALAPRHAATDCLGAEEQPELDSEGRLVLNDHGVIAVGDFNVAAARADVHPTYSFDGLYDERELAELHGLMAAYPDVWRRLHPGTEGVYSVWEERTSARAFNARGSA